MFKTDQHLPDLFIPNTTVLILKFIFHIFSSVRLDSEDVSSVCVFSLDLIKRFCFVPRRFDEKNIDLNLDFLFLVHHITSSLHN